MKGNAVGCNNCGKVFIKKRNNHKSCSTSCRVMYHRKKNGNPALPSFINSPTVPTGFPTSPTVPTVSTPTARKPSTSLVAQDFQRPQLFTGKVATTQVKPKDSSINIEIKRSDGLLWDLTMRRNQLIKIRDNANKKGGSFFAMAGFGLGVSKSDSIGSAIGKGIVFALLGGMIDSTLNNESKAKEVVLKANREIKRIEDRIRQIPKVKRIIEKMRKPIEKPIENKLLMPEQFIPSVAIDSKMGVILSSSDYKKQNIPTINLQSKWSYLLGNPGEGFFMLLTGSPGNGKSTFSVEFSEYFHKNHGKVLYLASEQKGLNKSLQGLLRKYNTSFSIHTKPKNSVDAILKDSKGFKMIVVDSVNHLGLTHLDIEEIRDKRPDLCIIGVMQSTKDGNYKGAQEFLHDCDIRIDMRQMIAYQTKSRFAPPSKLALEY